MHEQADLVHEGAILSVGEKVRPAAREPALGGETDALHEVPHVYDAVLLREPATTRSPRAARLKKARVSRSGVRRPREVARS